MSEPRLEVGIDDRGVGAPAIGALVIRRQAGWLRVLRVALGVGRTQLGLAIVGSIVLLSLLGPIIAPHSPTDFVGQPFTGPAPGSILGTDELGRDVFSRVLWGGYTILALSAIATALGVAMGVGLGVLAAYSRGFLDDLVMRSLDVILSFPQIILILLFVSLLGPQLWLIALTIAGLHAPPVARVARAASLGIRHRDFVRAAEANGIAAWRVMIGEIVPNISSQVLVELGLRLTWSIGLVASLSFLGFGVQPPKADWGLMINENRLAILIQPLPVIIPVLLIAMLTIGANLVTDGIARTAVGIERVRGHSA